MDIEVARRLFAAVEAALESIALPAPTTARLVRYATRHLPVEERAEGSPFIPPMYTLRVANAVGLPAEIAEPLAAAGCLFFAAADLADDCADGDVRTSVGVDINDTCHLLFAHQMALLALPLDDQARLAVLSVFAQAGRSMAIGQEVDLEATDRLGDVSALDVARGKSGGELSAFFASPAIAAGRAPGPWADFGIAFGALVQVLTDYFDLFLDPTSDDWEAGKPTLALQTGLGHPEHGPALRLLLAGDRAGHDRKSRGLWHLVQADAGAALKDAMVTLGGEMEAAAAALGDPAALLEIRAEILEWCAGVVDALEEYARDEAPAVLPLQDEVAACRTAALQFLDSDPTLEEATEIHRHGLFGVAEVRGGLFGRAVALDALKAEPFDRRPALAATFALADPDGWRYYPGHQVLPTDADCVGVMMQLAAGRPEASHPAMALGRRLLDRRDNQDAAGLHYTWLADPPEHARATIDAVWAGEVCPGAAANALVGLWLHDRRAATSLGPRLAALASRLLGEVAPASEFYPPGAVDYMASRALIRLRGALPLTPAQRTLVDAGLDAAARRFEGRRRLSGGFGDSLQTALAAWVLKQLGRLAEPAPVIRALVDGQEADGGYPADPFYRTVPHPVTRWYGSRVVTTAYVLQALRVLEPD